MRKLLTIIAFFCVTSVLSQDKYSSEEGKVTMSELLMTTYDEDPDAEALVIYDKGDYRFITDYTKGFMLRMTRKVKIKILKQAGESYAEISIPYYVGSSESETVDEIEATTYNWDGNSLLKTELDRKKIFEEKNNKNVFIKKIALSDVRVGSIIEYSYTIISPFLSSIREWDFQKRIPVLSSILTYRAIPYYEYSYIVKGIDKFDIQESKEASNEERFRNLVYKELIWTMGMKNVAAFRDEYFITSPKDYIISMNFQLSRIHNPHGGKQDIVSTWGAMCDDFLKNDYFGKYIKASTKQYKAVSEEIDLKGKTEVEKLKSITNYVKVNYKWDGITSKYSTDKLTTFLRQKTGNSADINLHLIGLLKGAGLKVNPMVLSTRKNGVVSLTMPFKNFLNYVMAEVEIGDEKYYIDAVEDETGFNQLPERCLNVQALVVEPKSEKWLLLQQSIPSVFHKKIKMKILPESNKSEVDIEYITYGRDAQVFRSIAKEEGKKEEENLKDFLKEKNNITVKDSVRLENLEDKEKPFTFYFSADYGIESTSDKIFINPLCSLGRKTNPFTQKNRKLPIDLVYNMGDKYSTEIEIPEGYQVEHMPKNINVDKELFTVKYNVEIRDNKIIVETEYYLKDSLFPASAYKGLQTIMNSVITQFAEMIVLSKKS